MKTRDSAALRDGVRNLAALTEAELSLVAAAGSKPGVSGGGSNRPLPKPVPK